MDISERIINRMKEIGLSQKEFSRLSGIPESTISDWKKKGNTPKSEKLLEICDILGLSIYELLGREVKVVGEKGDEYTAYVSKVDLQIIKELKTHKKLYEAIASDPKRTIELLDRLYK